MQKNALCTIIVCLLLVQSGGVRAQDPEDLVKRSKKQVEQDIAEAETFTCGGMYQSDDRLHAYYYRHQQPLECRLTYICDSFDEVTGDCNGSRCKIYYEDGKRLRTLKEDCSSGTCVEIKPHTSCAGYINADDITQYAGVYRKWECDKGSLKEAHCYSYLPGYQYDQSYYPMAFNCKSVYRSSPVRSTEPKGELAIFPPLDARPDPKKGREGWQNVQGSNVATKTISPDSFPVDDALSALTLNDASVHAQIRREFVPYQSRVWLQDYPDLDPMLSKLLDPPEIRLILPTGGVAFPQTAGFTLEDWKPFLSSYSAEKQMIVSSLDDNPDILLLAAHYLRSSPLFEVRYKPVTVQVPVLSQLELHTLAKDWEVFLDQIRKHSSQASSPLLSQDAEAKVQENIDAIRSYIALQDSIREYRIMFPAYLHELLTYTEKANEFFQKHWLSVNADRLEEWHEQYSKYLPALRERLRAVQEKALTFTEQCLVPACRLDVLPVKSDVQPWALFPKEETATLALPEFTLEGDERAWLPEGFPLWEPSEQKEGSGEPLARGDRVRSHVTSEIGITLPDLTFDFSEILRPKTIEVPVLRVERMPFGLLRPPFDPEKSPDHILDIAISNIENLLPKLPRFSPPISKLVFPKLILPDPKHSLLVVPSPPIALPTWKRALDWKEKRLDMFINACDTDTNPLTFLFSEHFITSGERIFSKEELMSSMNNRLYQPIDTARIRITMKVNDPGRPRAGFFFGSSNITNRFSSLTPSIPRWNYYYFNGVYNRYYNYFYPSDCIDCDKIRPQRYIKQTMQLEQNWDDLQYFLLTVSDSWNAQVRYHSIVSRTELEQREDQPWETGQPTLKQFSPPPL